LPIVSKNEQFDDLFANLTLRFSKIRQQQLEVLNAAGILFQTTRE
jgi:hypothetical protein